MAHIDPELALYRDLMEVPDKFEEGFDIKSIIGAIFVGFVMMPGAIYLGLVAGQSLGPAAEWTTIILFTEVARRSFITLKRQEIYILFYIASSLTGTIGGLQLAGGAFAGKIWDQYFVRSPAAEGMGIASQVPTWVVPPPTSEAIMHRTFLHADWLIPGAILLLGTLLGRMNWFGLGYVLFRITSDYEKLPFPFAAITAQGSTALAEATSKEETWRWRTFSIGAMVGLVFGTFYVGIPTITGAIMTEPLQLLPIPWVDLTRTTASILPAVPTGFVTDLGTIGSGFVVPYWAVVGSFISAIGTFILNPWLYRHGILVRWKPEMGTIETQFNNTVDFYFSIGIGVSFAVAAIGIGTIVIQLIRDAKHRQRGEKTERSWKPPAGRGDLPRWIAIALFVVSTIGYVILCWALVPKFPLIYVILFGFVLTPLNSYIDARMIGLTGQWVGIPMVKEAAIIKSGYRGIDIWFAPIPNFDHGAQAMRFRVLELTGTRVTGLIKAELLIWPITIFCSLLFWQFIWRLAPIPSIYYPYAQKMWHMQALQRGLWMTSTINPETSLFYKAWNLDRAIWGFVFGIGSYMILARLRLPIMLIYGIVRGLGTLPHSIFPEMIGALISQYYFVPRFGAKRWKQYATVLMAGYSCGMGLIGMGTVAIAMVSKSVSQMPY
ncbi:MAG: peptide transporter [Armatimonadia bacterium]